MPKRLTAVLQANTKPEIQGVKETELLHSIPEAILFQNNKNHHPTTPTKQGFAQDLPPEI